MFTGLGIGLSLAGGYVIASCLLLKYPQCLHRKKKPKFKPRCVHISHRGGAGEHLENTMAAFQNAADQGTNMFEIDLHLTKDNVVVISHDNNLKRVTGHDLLISDVLYKDLPQLKSTLSLDFAYEKTCTSEVDNKIVILDDLFKKYPSMPINIDIKADNDLLIKLVSELIVKYNRESLTVWGNYREKVTYKCYKENPNIPLLFSFRRVFYLVLLTYSGLLPFFPIRESCLELFLPRIFYKAKPELMSTGMGRIFGIFLFLADKLLMRKFIFDHLQKRGIQVFLWVLNDEEDFKKAFELGATGVMTDYPTKLKKYLESDASLQYTVIGDVNE